MAFQGFNGRTSGATPTFSNAPFSFGTAVPASTSAPLSFGTATPAPANTLFLFGPTTTTSPNAHLSFGTIPRASANSQFSFVSAPSNPSPPQNSSFREKSPFVSQPNQSPQPPQPRLQASPPMQRMGDQRKAPGSYSPLAHERSKTVYYSNTYDAQEDASTKQTYSRAPKRDRSPQLPSPVVVGSPLLLDSRRMADQRKAPGSYFPLAHERSKTVDYSDVYDAQEDASTKKNYYRAPKRDRSPHTPSFDAVVSPAQLDSQRMTDQRKAPGSYSPLAHGRSKTVDYSDIYDAEEEASTKQTYSRTPKRDRSPHPPSYGVLDSSVQLDSEREMQAKARRLARFNVELSQPSENLLSTKKKTSDSKLNQASLDKLDIDIQTEGRGSWNKDNLNEFKILDSSQAVTGLCPDMCPESERGERERKGDLDRYERLDGDRNQTSKYLAVKKYNRTAEREADLIRPMPILQKTVDYLLDLLHQPYNEEFLSIYNFLWDRMRAVRMDLRMQHIFNHQAIVMLEQMIRLHIVAMHELCEYNKGEGFSEGFDAHLNIEQMNKTSVELFQMYDDHRKKGMSVPTEKEFRGYYALLKLDKHPGYKVKPSELSLDLAKMTPEIRCSTEILFARDVARACRIGNYISFFRLARKATYLQACLMHAHFAKLRTQALASLHSSLQNNQGIPVTDIINWLGLEEEDVESLLDYHGFGLKKFEETYMVKEGPFLNSDADFPTKHSHIVQLKKSRMILGDIYSGPTTSDVTNKRETVSDGVTEISTKTPDVVQIRKSQGTIQDTVSAPTIHNSTKKRETVSNELHAVNQIALVSQPVTWKTASKDVIHDYGALPVSWGVTQPAKLFEVQSVPSTKLLEVQSVPFINKTNIQAAEVYLPCHTADHAEKEDEQMVDSEKDSSTDHEYLTNPEVPIARDLAPVSSVFNNAVISPMLHTHTNRELNNKEQLLVIQQRKHVAEERLRRILRKWKQKATRKRETREERIMLANAALSSLSRGPPVRQHLTFSRLAHNELNIDYTAREIHGRQGKSWSTINVSEVVAPVLSSTNPDAQCLCWKLLLLVQPSLEEGQTNCVTSRWLVSKMMGRNQENDKPIVSVPHLSIWSWINSQRNHFYPCCLSTVREASFDNNDLICEDLVTGASSIMFHVSEGIPWETQRMRLHNVLARVPSRARLPLLIVSGDVYDKEITDPSLMITRRLGLHDADMTRISSFSVVFLCGSYSKDDFSIGFFKDEEIRDGLLWLAEHSPKQPTICLMKTRDVVMDYLIASEEVLENEDSASNLGPDNFISVFNAALDRLVEEIVRAASSNVNHWPNPEIDLIEKSSNERVFVDSLLPIIGWSSPMRIEPVLKAINSCKLPEFSHDLSSLEQGSYMGLEIEDQKLALEKSLMKYMTQSCQMLNAELAAREAGILVQTGAGLQLRGSNYYIIPRWLIIFRRIQNWRLINLTAGLGSAAYLLEQQQDRLSSVQGIAAATPQRKIGATQEGFEPVHPFPTRLFFDKIVELSCNIPLTKQPEPSTPTAVHGGYDASKTDDLKYNRIEDFKYNSLPRAGDDRALVSSPSQMDDNLSMLLERCTRLQDTIDGKLAIYF